jgi:hypothetical protein
MKMRPRIAVTGVGGRQPLERTDGQTEGHDTTEAFFSCETTKVGLETC